MRFRTAKTHWSDAQTHWSDAQTRRINVLMRSSVVIICFSYVKLYSCDLFSYQIARWICYNLFSVAEITPDSNFPAK